MIGRTEGRRGAVVALLAVGLSFASGADAAPSAGDGEALKRMKLTRRTIQIGLANQYVAAANYQGAVYRYDFV